MDRMKTLSFSDFRTGKLPVNKDKFKFELYNIVIFRQKSADKL